MPVAHLLPPKDWRAVFFDFDGVLADSVPVKTEAFVALYEEHGPEIMDKVRAYHLRHGGKSRFEKIRHYEAEFLGAPASEALVAEKAERFARLVKEKVVSGPEMTGARACLETLAARGLPLYVVSGTPEEELLEIVERRGLRHFFRHVRGTPPAKPELLTGLVAEEGLPPAHCVMIGDSITDWEAAEAAGTQFIGISEGISPFPAAISVHPHLAALMAAYSAKEAAHG
jgi:HAD superfamily hydrolase (TIGR01549 family)